MPASPGEVICRTFADADLPGQAGAPVN